MSESNVRRRTTRQSAQASSDGEELIIQDNEGTLSLTAIEQKAEIRKLNAENESSNARARQVMLVAVGAIVVLNAWHIIAHIRKIPLILIATVRTILLIACVAPPWLPYAETIRHRLWIPVCAQLYLGAIATCYINWQEGPLSELYPQLATMLVSLAVYIQKLGETRAAKSLEELEKLKYDLKGA